MPERASALITLNSIEGQLVLGNGQTTNMTPGSGTLTNTGSFLINNSGTTVSVNGNALNTGYLAPWRLQLRERRRAP